MSLRSRFVDQFGEDLAARLEAAVESHIPRLGLPVDRGSDPFRFTLVWTVGLECASRPAFRAEHGIVTAWLTIRDWLRDADAFAGYDGTWDWGGRGAAMFDGILPSCTSDDIDEAWAATLAWLAARPRRTTD